MNIPPGWQEFLRNINVFLSRATFLFTELKSLWQIAELTNYQSLKFCESIFDKIDILINCIFISFLITLDHRIIINYNFLLKLKNKKECPCNSNIHELFYKIDAIWRIEIFFNLDFIIIIIIIILNQLYDNVVHLHVWLLKVIAIQFV